MFITLTLITKHAPIGKYRLRFFPNKLITCSCGNSHIETRAYTFTWLQTVSKVMELNVRVS